MEVEIKVKIDNIDRMEEQIKRYGGILLRESREIDEYFNHPCRDFRITDEALRIRNDLTLTYKGPKVDNSTKSREEINLKIDDLERAREILYALGFKYVGKVIKNRKYYKLEDLTITLDDVEGLGSFMEVECIGEYSICKEKVLNFAQTLKLKNFIQKSYLELILENKIKEE